MRLAKAVVAAVILLGTSSGIAWNNQFGIENVQDCSRAGEPVVSPYGRTIVPIVQDPACLERVRALEAQRAGGAQRTADFDSHQAPPGTRFQHRETAPTYRKLTCAEQRAKGPDYVDDECM